jgi:hypothetical protein
MTTGLPKPPTFRSILFGIALFIIALLAFLRIADVVKYSGTALMYIPAKLGLIDMVMPNDVIPLPLEENPSLITIPSPGQYVMYLNNYDMLIVHDAIVAGDSEPWMKLQSENLNTQVEMILIGRGLTWYDTPFARGRPVVRFTIDQPGTYQFTHPARQDYMYLVPDTMTGKESLITFWVLAEIALIGGLIFYIFRRRTESTRQKRIKTQAESRARVEDTWKRIEKRKEEKQKDEDQPYWKKR